MHKLLWYVVGGSSFPARDRVKAKEHDAFTFILTQLLHRQRQFSQSRLDREAICFVRWSLTGNEWEKRETTWYHHPCAVPSSTQLQKLYSRTRPKPDQIINWILSDWLIFRMWDHLLCFAQLPSIFFGHLIICWEDIQYT